MAPEFPSVPYGVQSLIGRRFDHLKVLHYAGSDDQGHARWCCECRCGARCKVPGRRLLTGQQVSCGCRRADPKVRRAARLKVAPRKRHAIAVKAGEASRKVPHRPAYALHASQAADMLGVSLEIVEQLARDGVLGSRTRKGEIYISVEDLSDMMAQQCREKKRCATFDTAQKVRDRLAAEQQIA